MKVTHLPESHCWWQNTSRILWQKNLKRSFRTPFVWFPLYLSMYRLLCRVSGKVQCFRINEKKTLIDSNHRNPLDETSTRWGFVTKLFDRPRTSNLTLAPTCCALAKAGHQEIRDPTSGWVPDKWWVIFWVSGAFQVFFFVSRNRCWEIKCKTWFITPNGLCTYMYILYNV